MTAFILAFRAELASRRFLAWLREAPALLGDRVCAHLVSRRSGGWETSQRELQAFLADGLVWLEVVDGLAENGEKTLIRPVSRVRPYQAGFAASRAASPLAESLAGAK